MGLSPKILEWMVQGHLNLCLIGEDKLEWVKIVKEENDESYFSVSVLKDVLPLGLFNISIDQYKKFTTLEEAKLHVQEMYNLFCNNLMDYGDSNRSNCSTPQL